MAASALAGGAEPVSPPTASADQIDRVSAKESAAKAATAVAARNAAMEQDITRRRELFTRGARSRWTENSKRIKSQILGDLKLLDRLVATSVL